MKPSGIGGMAVIEGVMMKNKDEYAVAVRKPDNEIAVEKNTHKSLSEKVKIFQLPILRGMVAFVDSMVIGVKILSYSASFFEEEEEKEKDNETKNQGNKSKNSNNSKTNQKNSNNKKATKKNTKKSGKNGKKQEKVDTKTEETNEGLNALLMAGAVVISIGMAILLFMVFPVLVAQLFSKFVMNGFALSLLEGVLRIIIFVGYIILISQMPDIKRLFMYHGAEHKTINCIENGFELTLENVKWQSKLHKRCGTSFMLIVMVISVIFFIFVPVDNIAIRIISRILFVPIIAGVSYEFIRLAGKSDSLIVNILSKPGMLMQGLTTKEPNDDMIEVAIKSVETVFDWRSFLEQNQGNDENKKVRNKTKSKKKVTGIESTFTATEIKTKDFSDITEDVEEDEILSALDKYLDIKGDDTDSEGNRKVM